MAKPALYGIKACDTMKKAMVWLDSHGIAFDFHDYKKEGADPVLLAQWCDAQGWEKVLNRAGTTFRKVPDQDKQNLDRDHAIALMLAQPSMIKRPVLVMDGRVDIGFSPDRYAAFFDLKT